MSICRLTALAIAIVLPAGCASMPKPLQGTYAHVSAASAEGGVANSGPVRWGGRILHTASDSQRTCFTLLAQPLDYQARPRADLVNSGTPSGFVTCHAGTYDPEVFAKGRELTVIGTLHGTMRQQAGGRELTLPMVNADVVYLWPKRKNATFPADAWNLMGNPQYPSEADRQPAGKIARAIR